MCVSPPRPGVGGIQSSAGGYHMAAYGLSGRPLSNGQELQLELVPVLGWVKRLVYPFRLCTWARYVHRVHRSVKAGPLFGCPMGRSRRAYCLNW